MWTETRREKFVGRFLKFVSIVDLFRSAKKLLPCAELLFFVLLALEDRLRGCSGLWKASLCRTFAFLVGSRCLRHAPNASAVLSPPCA